MPVPVVDKTRHVRERRPFCTTGGKYFPATERGNADWKDAGALHRFRRRAIIRALAKRGDSGMNEATRIANGLYRLVKRNEDHNPVFPSEDRR